MIFNKKWSKKRLYQKLCYGSVIGGLLMSLTGAGGGSHFALSAAADPEALDTQAETNEGLAEIDPQRTDVNTLSETKSHILPYNSG